MARNPAIRTDFPGGNGVAFEWTGPGRLRFVADRRGGPCSMWFHFQVSGLDCDVLRCELMNGREALGWPYRSYVRPVFRRAGEGWERTAPTEIDAEAGVMRFEAPCAGEDVEIAFCYPYQADDWRNFLGTTLAPAGGRMVPIGTSERGRALEVCEWGGGPLTVWLTARSHAGETPGSYALEGILAALIGAGRSDLSVRCAPMLDLDAVVEGMYGKNRLPVDFYMGWSEAQERPEIRAYKDYLLSLPHRPRVAVDCHAPLAQDPNLADRSSVGAEVAERLSRLMARVTQRCGSDPATALSPQHTGAHPGWHTGGVERCQPGWLQATFGAAAFTLETAYHQNYTGHTVGPDEWRRMGRSIGAAIVDYLS